MGLFEEYKNHPDKDVRERANNWGAAIGLQNVDGLSVSEFLIQLARQQIEGEITMDEVAQRLNEHYEHSKLYSSTYEIVPPNSEMIKRMREENELSDLGCINKTMETPFTYGKIAINKNFINREVETANLVWNFVSLSNTIIIAPRGWGKSSLVNKSMKLAMEQDSKLRICHIDLFNVRNEERFYSLLAQKVIAATSTKWEEAVENAKSFFSHLVPKISIGTDPTNEVSIDFDWDDVKRNPDEVLDLAEKIAKQKGLKIVVCVDEFQNIAEFADPDYFQKKLRSHWQQHQSVAYCLYGSKRHMMMEVFTNSSKPFYKFGNLMFLNKIDTPYLVEFFNSRFEDTGKSINEDAANLIVKLVDNHPYYAQQLAQQSWLRTKDICTVEIVHEAHAALVEQLSLLFVTITETLTTQQLNYLKALIAGEKAISSTDVMHRYQISSPTSVARSKAALIKNDILDNKAGEISFQDPIYAYWLKNEYFAK